MLDNADSFLRLMKDKIDKHLESILDFQQFLAWIYQKANATASPYKKSAIRAFYISIYRDPAESLSLELFRSFARRFGFDIYSNLDQEPAIMRARDLARKLGFESDWNLGLDPKLQGELEELKRQIPNRSFENREAIRQWLQTDGKIWKEQLDGLRS